MKKLIIILLIVLSSIFVYSCNKKLPVEPTYPPPDKRLTIDINIETGNFIMMLEKLTDQYTLIINDADVCVNGINVPYSGGGLYDKYIGILTPGDTVTVNISSYIGNFSVSGNVPEHHAEILSKYKEDISGCNHCDVSTYFRITNGVPYGF